MSFNLLAFYGGPDQVMTVTSGIASIIGVLMLFWHKLVAAFFKLIGRAPETTDATTPPSGGQVNPPTKPS